jgi:bifunctional non-homologous end joining protein LigD
MGLKKYNEKRDFSKTPEPSRGKPLPTQVLGTSRFVIQKHDASRLHYDFRLQMEGVLKSWALPKGLPWAKGEKHLAVQVEDHPIDYEDFEGIIPEGQYGGGTVMIWDRGGYYVFGEQPLKSLREGRLHLVLAGEKARGEWTLVRIRGRDGKKNTWLIIKTGDNIKAPSKKDDDRSVKTSRTMEQIAKQREAEWQSGRREEATTEKSKLNAQIKAAVKKKVENKIVGRAHRLPTSGNGDRSDRIGKALPNAKPRFIEPMKARLVEEPPAHGNWLYELKFDGIRAIAVKDGTKASLISRNGNELDKRFPEIAEAVKDLPVRECVIDGEAVALDEEGRSSFQLLQALEMEGRKAPLRFYVFDLLDLNGKSLLELPVEQRKEVLANICENIGDPIRYSGEISGDVNSLLAEVQRRGLEGLIGKQRGSKYEPGLRSGAWIKLKAVQEQEFVIGGYTPPAGSRRHFGAILVGYYENGKLRFTSKVGSGFTEKSLAMVHKKFRAEERKDCPFTDLPSKHTGRSRPGITPSMMKKMNWVNPKFVAQIKFSEWTRDGKLRQPVFLGLRDDKKPTEVRREAG